jgi:hypothetical protein
VSTAFSAFWPSEEREPFFERLQISAELWVECVENFHKWFRSSVDRPKSMSTHADMHGHMPSDQHHVLAPGVCIKVKRRKPSSVKSHPKDSPVALRSALTKRGTGGMSLFSCLLFAMFTSDRNIHYGVHRVETHKNDCDFAVCTRNFVVEFVVQPCCALGNMPKDGWPRLVNLSI